jgi:hypothetical protein
MKQKRRHLVDRYRQQAIPVDQSNLARPRTLAIVRDTNPPTKVDEALEVVGKLGHMKALTVCEHMLMEGNPNGLHIIDLVLISSQGSPDRQEVLQRIRELYDTHINNPNAVIRKIVTTKSIILERIHQ